MKLAVISFTVNGTRLNRKLCAALSEKLQNGANPMKPALSETCTQNTKLKTNAATRDEIPIFCYVKSKQPPVLEEAGKQPECMVWQRSLNDWAREMFASMDALIFIGATGIAVRAIAPLVQDKFYDPAVLVMDELGQFCIPLLSGHVGGANELAETISRLIGSQAVITTATDVNHQFAVDVFARKNGLKIVDRELAKEISAELLTGRKVGFFTDFLWNGTLPKGLCEGQFCDRNIQITINTNSLKDSLKKRAKKEGYDTETGAQPKETDRSETCSREKDILRLVPPVIILGIGCRKGTPAGHIQAAIHQLLKEQNLHPLSIAAIATIDLKKEELGLLAAAEALQTPVICYSSEELAAVPGDFAESAFVKQITGVGNVCERAALKAARERGGYLVCHKTVYDGVTVAAARIPHSGITF